MLRKVLVLCVAAGILAAPLSAQTRELMPGVTYRSEVQFTRHGPVVMHVLTAPRPTGLYGLKPVLSNNAILGTERVTAIQQTVSTSATTAGINGDLFSAADGHPSGVLLQDGELKTRPLPGRSSIGVARDGTLRVERVSLLGTWQGTGQRRPLNALNARPGANQLTLYTSAYGPATPPVPDTLEVVLQPFGGATPGDERTSPVTQVKQNGSTPIPPGGAVLVGRGTQAARLTAEAQLGRTVTTRFVLKPDWRDIGDAVGGGPVLIREGRPVFNPAEQFADEQLLPRAARSAVGQLADGRIVLVAVDGGQPGYSVGVTNFELAQALVRLGAVTGSALDGANSTTMAFEGQLLNRPSNQGGERSVAEALLVQYYGVWAAEPLTPVVSPNGDGVGERQSLAYKVVRPSTVTVSLVAPDRSTRFTETAQRPPGFYPVPFSPTKPDGSPEVEGGWSLSVSAVDSAGATSSAERSFAVNNTLGALRAPGLYRLAQAGPPLRFGYTLTRPAEVAATVETGAGAVVRSFGRASMQAGTAGVGWDGRDGRGALAHTGRYVVRVVAVNALGRTELTTPFLIRRIATARR